MKKLLLLFMFAVLALPVISYAGVKAPDVLDDETIITDQPLTKYKVVGVRPFSIDDVEYENVDDDEMRQMKKEIKKYQKLLAKTIRDNLNGSGFKAVLLDGKGNGKADMVIEGEIVMVDLGSTAARIIVGFMAGQSGIGVEGRLVDAKTGDTLAKFEHESTSGLDERYNKWAMVEKEVGEMGDDIAEFVEKLR